MAATASTHGDVVADGGELLLGLAGDGEAAELGESLLHPPSGSAAAPLGWLVLCAARPLFRWWWGAARWATEEPGSKMRRSARADPDK